MVHVVLVSGWQTVNIGDVAHTPGALRAFQRYAPEVKLTLWARSIDEGVRRMLGRYFPDVEIVEDRVVPGEPLSPELERLFAEGDLLVHGSGPSLVARVEVAEWHRRTGKPHGIFGVTVDPLRPYGSTLARAASMVSAIDGDLLTELEREVLDTAAFVYCRDSLTERFLAGQGLGAPTIAFGPDATVMFDVVDDGDGQAVLAEYGLYPGRFLCVVPRLRFTPYHQIRNYPPAAEDVRRTAYNAGYLKSDLDVLRQTVIGWVRATGEPAIVVPEMSYAMELAETEFAGTFPADVADEVHILPRFWDLTEAAAVYRRAGAVVSMECHSPLIALAEGIPSIYLRQPTDTIKGEMYNDLGMPFVELGPGADAAAGQLLQKIVDDRPAAAERVQETRDGAQERVRGMVQAAVAAVGSRIH
ncbi:polysaccharide pyruvyl transferase family protein [Kribbella sp. NPDC004875]|uniref:polysaccharide pyruvyl transferase family protein n=1 Tax=Kribbella sp. NPDC004875 TaxID=3364107 RepID=UPI0036A61176